MGEFIENKRAENCKNRQIESVKFSKSTMALFRPMAGLLMSTTRTLPALSSRLYHEKVIDHYEKPRNVGKLDAKKKTVGTGLVGAPACGDVMKLQIEVDDNGKIVDAKFKTFGCGRAIASSSLATEWIKGKSLDDAGKIKNSDIAKELFVREVRRLRAAVSDEENQCFDFDGRNQPKNLTFLILNLSLKGFLIINSVLENKLQYEK